jgi:diguanylate cyclase (GGDEF)-like protein
MDLDQFKVVNDSCGHLGGDQLLCEVTSAIMGVIRKHDILARLGGDEFGLLLEDCNIVHAKNTAEKIREVIENFRFSWDDRIFSIGISIGISPITNNNSTLADILSAADSACYAAKNNGRNLVRVFGIDNDKVSESR